MELLNNTKKNQFVDVLLGLLMIDCCYQFSFRNWSIRSFARVACLGMALTFPLVAQAADPDTISFSLAASATADESANTFIVTAVISGGSDPTENTAMPITIDVTDAGGGSATSGADYTAIPTTTLTFLAGSVNGDTQSFSLTVLSDTSIEGDETVNLQLSNISGGLNSIGVPSTHTVTITDDDFTSVDFQAASSSTADETAGNHAITLVLTAAGPIGADVTVDVTDAGGGTATSTSDYSSVGTTVVTFPMGSGNGATQTFNLGVLADTDVEADETVNLQISNPTGGAGLGAQTTHQATILDDDDAVVQFQNAGSATADETAGNHAVTVV